MSDFFPYNFTSQNIMAALKRDINRLWGWIQRGDFFYLLTLKGDMMSGFFAEYVDDYLFLIVIWDGVYLKENEKREEAKSR